MRTELSLSAARKIRVSERVLKEPKDGFNTATTKSRASSDAIKDSVIDHDEIHLPVSDDHYRNFLESVKSRKDPIEPVEAGHRTASICHLGNIAMRPKTETEVGPRQGDVRQ